MKRITMIVLSAVTFLLALGLTIYPVVSVYVTRNTPLKSTSPMRRRWSRRMI